MKQNTIGTKVKYFEEIQVSKLIKAESNTQYCSGNCLHIPKYEVTWDQHIKCWCVNIMFSPEVSPTSLLKMHHFESCRKYFHHENTSWNNKNDGTNMFKQDYIVPLRIALMDSKKELLSYFHSLFNIFWLMLICTCRCLVPHISTTLKF